MPESDAWEARKATTITLTADDPDADMEVIEVRDAEESVMAYATSTEAADRIVRGTAALHALTGAYSALSAALTGTYRELEREVQDVLHLLAPLVGKPPLTDREIYALAIDALPLDVYCDLREQSYREADSRHVSHKRIFPGLLLKALEERGLLPANELCGD